MSDPSKKFSKLSISSSEMQLSFEKRVAISRDILSSFDSTIFPSEFRLDLSTDLVSERKERPEHEWNRHGDVEGSLLVWMSFDDAALELGERMQKQSDRDLGYFQKLGRRLDESFRSYDALAKPDESEIHQPLSIGDLRDRLEDIAQDLRKCVQAAKVDGFLSIERQEMTARRLIAALVKVCERDGNLPVQGSEVVQSDSPGQKSNTEESKISLFDSLIRSPATGTSAFMVDFFESVSNETLVEIGARLQEVDVLLAQQAAPAYRSRFDALIARAKMAAAQSERKITASEQVEGPRTGSKRSGGNGRSSRGGKRRA